MGRLVIQNVGISIEVLLALLAELELELHASNDDPVLKRAVVMTGGAFVCDDVCSCPARWQGIAN